MRPALQPQQIDVSVLVHLSCAAQLKSQIHPDGRAEKIARAILKAIRAKSQKPAGERLSPTDV